MVHFLDGLAVGLFTGVVAVLFGELGTGLEDEML
jgi:hypothetical protein